MADNSGIMLFKLNKIVGNSALKTLNRTSKSAIIQRIDMGKSLIAFKLCKDSINKKIFRFFSGECIFKTQCENLAAVDSAVQDSIAFCLLIRHNLIR